MAAAAQSVTAGLRAAALVRVPVLGAIAACWRASPGYTVAVIALSIAAGLVPLAVYVAFAVFAGGVLAEPRPWPIEVGAALVVVPFAALQLRNPLTILAIGRLGRRLDTWLHRRVMDAALGPRTIGHLSSETFQAAASAAREWEAAVHPPSAAAWAITYFISNWIVAIGSAVLVMQFAWWAPIPLAIGYVLLGRWGTRFRELPAAVRHESDGRFAVPGTCGISASSPLRRARPGSSAWVRGCATDRTAAGARA